MFGDDAQYLDAFDKTLKLVQLHDQPLLVVVEERLLTMVVENHLRRGGKLQRTTRVNLSSTHHLN